MSSEKQGALFEAMVYIALQDALVQSRIPGQIVWNAPLAGVQIVPDLQIETFPHRPSHIFMLTTSEAAHNSHMKMWRNLAEIFETKTQLPTQPRLIHIYTKTPSKKHVSQIMDAITDGSLYIDQQPYAETLQQWLLSNTNKQRTSQKANRKRLEKALQSQDALQQAMQAFSKDLVQLLQQENQSLKSLWTLIKTDNAQKKKLWQAQKTSVRRGLAKLMVIPATLRENLYKGGYAYSQKQRETLPELLFTLGFFHRTLSGSRLVDEEIKGVIQHLGSEQCERTIAQAPDSVYQWIRPLQTLHRIPVHIAFVQAHYQAITTPEGLLSLFKKCYQDPSGCSGLEEDQTVWLFEILISLLKAASGKWQGYGSAQLAQDTQLPSLLKGLHGLRITPFIQRQTPLSENQLQQLATGLAKRIQKSLPPEQILSLQEQVVQWVIKENLEDRLIPYRHFEPLMWLLESALQKNDIAYEVKRPYTGWFHEYMSLDNKAATTPFIRAGETFFHWKSVSNAGKFHKRKELSARIRNHRYHYLSETGTFTHRSDFQQTVLIVDGTFDSNALRELHYSGWDVLLYPDEIEAFVQGMS